MTKKQYACIMSAKTLIAKIQEIAYWGDIEEASEHCYEIDMMCRKWLDDFLDVDPNWKAGANHE